MWLPDHSLAYKNIRLTSGGMKDEGCAVNIQSRLIFTWLLLAKTGQDIALEENARTDSS
jgi:hypothetical protein